MDSKNTTVVIGAGVVGLATALYLSVREVRSPSSIRCPRQGGHRTATRD